MTRLGLVALALIGAFLVVWTAIGVVYGVDLPFLDQWDRPLPQIARSFAGHIGFFDDLWPQHNEARKVVPTAISLGLAAVLGRFDAHVELAVGGIFFAAIVCAIAGLARAGRMSAEAALAVALLYAAIAGSVRTAYFHLYSVTFERLVPELAIVGSLGLLVAGGLTWRTAAIASALLVVGQYSYPGAIAGWLVVPGFAAVAFGRELRAAWPRLALLVGCGALSTLAYFWSYVTPAHHTPLGAVLAEPITSWLRFALRFLGNPITGSTRLATIAAAVAVLGLAIAGAAALRRTDRGPPRRAALAWIALGIYSLTQAGMATIARLPMGIGHAMRGDYIVHASYLYVAVTALLCMAAPPRARRFAAGAVVALSAASLLWLLTPGARRELADTRAARLAAVACVRSAGAPCDPGNFWLAPSVEVVRDRATRARALGVW